MRRDQYGTLPGWMIGRAGGLYPVSGRQKGRASATGRRSEPLERLGAGRDGCADGWVGVEEFLNTGGAPEGVPLASGREPAPAGFSGWRLGSREWNPPRTAGGDGSRCSGRGTQEPPRRLGMFEGSITGGQA